MIFNIVSYDIVYMIYHFITWHCFIWWTTELYQMILYCIRYHFICNIQYCDILFDMQLYHMILYCIIYYILWYFCDEIQWCITQNIIVSYYMILYHILIQHHIMCTNIILYYYIFQYFTALYDLYCKVL